MTRRRAGWPRCGRSTQGSGSMRWTCRVTHSSSSSSGWPTPSHPGCTSRPRWRSRQSARPGHPRAAWFCSKPLTSGVWCSSQTTGHARLASWAPILDARRCSHGTASFVRCALKVQRNGCPVRSRMRTSRPAPVVHSLRPGRLLSRRKSRTEDTWTVSTKRPCFGGQSQRAFLGLSTGEGFESSRQQSSSGRGGRRECTIAFTTPVSENRGKFADWPPNHHLCPVCALTTRRLMWVSAHRSRPRHNLRPSGGAGSRPRISDPIDATSRADSVLRQVLVWWSGHLNTIDLLHHAFWRGGIHCGIGSRCVC
jgi:hypothetical protein